MWYQKIDRLRNTNIENKDIVSILSIRASNSAFVEVVPSIRNNINGSVTKKIYIPESLWVIDDNAEAGRLIFVRSS